jgi:hypothetical protein
MKTAIVILVILVASVAAVAQSGEPACDAQLDQIFRPYPSAMGGGYNRTTEHCYLFFDKIPTLDNTAPDSLRVIASNTKTFAAAGVEVFLTYELTGSFRNARLRADFIKVGNKVVECQVERKSCDSRETFSKLLRESR